MLRVGSVEDMARSTRSRSARCRLTMVGYGERMGIEAVGPRINRCHGRT
jgi:hypothetical protein